MYGKCTLSCLVWPLGAGPGLPEGGEGSLSPRDLRMGEKEGGSITPLRPHSPLGLPQRGCLLSLPQHTPAAPSSLLPGLLPATPFYTSLLPCPSLAPPQPFPGSAQAVALPPHKASHAARSRCLPAPGCPRLAEACHGPVIAAQPGRTPGAPWPNAPLLLAAATSGVPPLAIPSLPALAIIFCGLQAPMPSWGLWARRPCQVLGALSGRQPWRAGGCGDLLGAAGVCLPSQQPRESQPTTGDGTYTKKGMTDSPLLSLVDLKFKRVQSFKLYMLIFSLCDVVRNHEKESFLIAGHLCTCYQEPCLFGVPVETIHVPPVKVHPRSNVMLNVHAECA